MSSIAECLTPAGIELVGRVRGGRGSSADIQALAALNAIIRPGCEDSLVAECGSLVWIYSRYEWRGGKKWYYIARGRNL